MSHYNGYRSFQITVLLVLMCFLSTPMLSVGDIIDNRQFQPTPNANSLECPIFVSLPISDAITYDWSAWLTDKNLAAYNANITDISVSTVDQVLQQARYSELFMLLLAIEHVNNKDGSIVAELAEYDCDIKIPRAYISGSASSSLKALLTGNLPEDIAIYPQHQENQEKFYNIGDLCGFIGPFHSNGADLLLDVLHSSNAVHLLPLIAFDKTKQSVPKNAAFILSDTRTLAMRILDFFIWQRREYIAFIYDESSPFCNEVWYQINQLNAQRNDSLNVDIELTISGFGFDGYVTEESNLFHVKNVLSEARKTKYSTIGYLNGVSTDIAATLGAAKELDMTTDEYIWLMVPYELMIEKHMLDIFGFRFCKNFYVLEYVPFHDINSHVKSSVLKLNIQENQHLHQLLEDIAGNIDGLELSYDRNKNSLEINELSSFAALVYDAVVSLALGLCIEFKSDAVGSHISGLFSESFTGVSGDVYFNRISHGRRPEMLECSVFSVWERGVEGKMLEVARTSEGLWGTAEARLSVQGTVSLQSHKQRLVTEDLKYMTKAMQSIYIALIFIIWIIGFVMLVLISKNSSLPQIKLAQPLYLKSLCIAAILITSCMIPLLLSRTEFAQNVDLDFCVVLSALRAFGFRFGTYVCFVKVVILWRDFVNPGKVLNFATVFFGRLFFLLFIPIAKSFYQIVGRHSLHSEKIILDQDEYGFTTISTYVCRSEDPSMVMFSNVPFFLICLFTIKLSGRCTNSERRLENAESSSFEILLLCRCLCFQFLIFSFGFFSMIIVYTRDNDQIGDFIMALTIFLLSLSYLFLVSQYFQGPIVERLDLRFMTSVMIQADSASDTSTVTMAITCPPNIHELSQITRVDDSSSIGSVGSLMRWVEGSDNGDRIISSNLRN